MAPGGKRRVLPPAVRPGAGRDGSLRAISLVRAATASPPGCASIALAKVAGSRKLTVRLYVMLPEDWTYAQLCRVGSGNASAQPEFIYNAGPADRVLLLTFGGR